MRHALPALLSLWLAIAAPLAAEEPPPGEQPVATLNGEAIYLSDLPVSPEERKLRQRLYELQMTSLGNNIANRLLEAAAEEATAEIEDYVNRQIGHKIGAPTNKEISAYYDSQREKINKPLKEVRQQIIVLLQRQKASAHLAELITELREAAELEIRLDPPRLPVSLEDVRSRGPEDAAVTVVEYSDFQCPFCRRVQPFLAELHEKYGDDVRWVFKDLPLVDIHPEAMRAAQAARCAGEQGKFWEYRAKLFEQELFTDAMYSDLAKELKIKASPLMECLESGKFEEPVLAEKVEAERLGIEGTPAILVNGILSTGARSIQHYDTLIGNELKAARATGATEVGALNP